MVNLNQINSSFEALETLGGEKEPIIEHIKAAMSDLQCALNGMDTIQVMGRNNIDTLLGCMMAVEAIIGDNENG